MSNKETKYTPCTLMVKDEEKAHRVSPFLIDIISRMVTEDDLSMIRRGIKSIDEVIKKLGIASRGNDPKGYLAVYEVLDYISGNYMKVDSYKEITISEHLDIAMIFNNQNKVNDFVYFLMNHIMQHKVNQHIPAVLLSSMLIIDVNFLLFAMQEFIIQEYNADKKEIQAYLKKHFLNTNKLSFLVNCIWGHTYAIVGSDIHFMMKRYKKKGAGWTDSIMEDLEGNQYHFKGVTLSVMMFESRLNNISNLELDHKLDYELYRKFRDYVITGELRQVIFGEKAQKYAKENEDVINFFRY